MGRLDVGAASGGAIVEVRHDGEVLPLFYDNGEVVTPGLPIPSGSVLRFPVRPGAITASVRDARKRGIDVSERYVTEPGKLRHIVRRLHLLTPGEAVAFGGAASPGDFADAGLEKPFQFFVEGAVKYPFGCIEQTSTKLLSMVTVILPTRITRNWLMNMRQLFLSGISVSRVCTFRRADSVCIRPAKVGRGSRILTTRRWVPKTCLCCRVLSAWEGNQRDCVRCWMICGRWRRTRQVLQD